MMTDQDFMQHAIDGARAGIAAGQTPFGAVIARDDEILIATHNHVWAETDITAHAEVCAIRLACRALGRVKLDDCEIYATTEPCPMCFAAIHWANMRRIVFGASIADAKAAGFSELDISNEQMKSLGGSPVMIEPGVLRDACRALFEQWRQSKHARPY